MADQDPGNRDNFDRLLAHRGEVAEFVNSFTSERVQRKAFSAVVRSLGLSGAPASELVSGADPAPLRLIKEEPVDTGGADSSSEAVPSDAGNGSGRRRRSGKTPAKRNYAIPKDLNWAPDGQPSLEAFVEEKRPRNNDEKSLIACVYLSQMMGLTVDTGRVLAVYQAAKWRAPSRPDTSLQRTASMHSWIDTADMTNIKVVWQGENHVTSKMPVEPKKTG